MRMDPVLVCARPGPAQDAARRVAAALPAAPRWGRLWACARAEGMAVRWMEVCRCAPLAGRIPSSVRAHWERYVAAVIGRTVVLLDDLRRLLEDLAGRGVEPIILKGTAGMRSADGRVALRSMQDIDFLARPEEMEVVLKAAGRLGYAPGSGETVDVGAGGFLRSVMLRNEEYGLLRFFHPHWHLVNASYPLQALAKRLDLDRLQAHATRADLGGFSARVLHPTHHFLYLCEHALKHCFERWILLADLGRAVGPAYASDLHPDREAYRLGWEAPLAIALEVLRRAFGEEFLPPPVGAGVVLSRSLPVRVFLALVARGVRGPGVNGLAYLGIFPTLADRARFLRGALWPTRRQLAQYRGISPEEVTWGAYGRRLAVLLRGKRADGRRVGGGSRHGDNAELMARAYEEMATEDREIAEATFEGQREVRP